MAFIGRASVQLLNNWASCSGVKSKEFIKFMGIGWLWRRERMPHFVLLGRRKQFLGNLGEVIEIVKGFMIFRIIRRENKLFFEILLRK